MLTVVASHADPASLGIRDALLALAPWEEVGAFGGLPVREGPGPLRMVEVRGLHLDEDGLDARLHAAGLPAGALVFASKHKSAAGRPSFTVHPVGNWGEAEHGGRARAFSPAPARLMAALLRQLAPRAAKGVDVTYEATHHGPLVASPACFLEVGSEEAAWRDPANAKVVAEALLAVAAAPIPQVPVALAVGGGHYQPRATDLARRGRAGFAHMLPKHALAATPPHVIADAIKASPGATLYYVDERDAEQAVHAAAVCEDHGLVRFA